MASDKGFPSKDRETSRDIPQDHVTAGPVREKQWAKDVVSHSAVREVGTDAAEAGSTTSTINATAHAAKVGDIIRFTSGNLSGQEVRALSVEANSIELVELLSEAPAASDAFQILRFKHLLVNADGSLATTAAAGGATEAKQDAIIAELQLKADLTETQPVSAASLPLPTGAATEATLASLAAEDFATQTTLAALLTELQGKADLAETQPVSAASLPLPTGAATEATLSSIDTDTSTIAGDTTSLDAKMPAQGAALTAASLPVNIASDQTVPVLAASLPLPSGAATEVTLASLEGKDFATQTTLAALLTELQAKADLAETQPVSAASLPLPTGAATEATLSSLNGKDFATQTTLAALLTELQAKADLAETQPVSAASLPLPTGAATETTLASLEGKDFATQTTLAALLTELQAKADLAETQPVSAASLPLPTGAATEATLASLAAEDFATEATLAAMSAKLPAALGQTTKAGSLSVTMASDQEALDVNLAAKDVTEFVRNDYTSTSVTTGAYVQLIASTSADISKMQIFDSSGQTLVIATGAAASEVDKFYVFPGGNGDIDVNIPSGTRISIKAVSATADAGEIAINLIG